MSVETLPLPLRRALEAKGYATLTAVQSAVAEAADGTRDLRITSQTGSGKTIALGIALVRSLEVTGRGAGTAAVVVAPTRELAAQVGRELAWFFAEVPLRVATLTGGTSLGLDFRALERAPDVVVGTPGRLVDHLERGSLVLDDTRVLVLDEADAMLDLGFRDELEAIVKRLPGTRRTHLVSATFAGEVLDLADTMQREPLSVQGEQAKAGHVDISYEGYVMHPDDREASLVNLLLASHGERALVFVRTRADATDVAEGLADHGFRARAISGELSQRERTATLEAFRAGTVHVLVATDVAARGLDIRDLGLVVHYDLPGDPDTFTHRSGRTGRAGKKGRCVVLVPESHRRKAAHLARACRVDLQLMPLPTPEEIAERVEARALENLSTAAPDEATRARYGRLAQALLATQDAEAAVAMLLGRSRALGPCEPLATRKVAPMALPRPAREGSTATPGYVRFQVSWGRAAGADPRRLLAVVCRRGDVDRHAIGAIRIQDQSSFVDVIEEAAEHFERAASERDPREPRIKFRRDRGPAMGPPGGFPSGPRPGGKSAPKRPRANYADGPKPRKPAPR